MERYRIIYMYKILHGLVDNPNSTVAWKENPRTGIHVNIPLLNQLSTPVRRLTENSFTYVSGRLYSSLPVQLRCRDIIPNVNNFKARLDTFLANVPDQPTVTSQPRAAESNSILHQAPCVINTNVAHTRITTASNEEDNTYCALM